MNLSASQSLLREGEYREDYDTARDFKMKCEWCAFRDVENLPLCKGCPNYDPTSTTTPRHDLEKVDIFEVASKLYDKEILEGWQSRKGKIPTLSDCPQCKRRYLQFDPVYNRFECRNKECALFGKLIRQPSKLFTQIVTNLLETE